MRRALVTGARGFIGRHALPALVARGYEVHAVTSTARPVDPQPGVVWHAADLLANGAAAALLEEVRPSHLLHLAWCATPPAFWTTPENFRWVEATLGLARAFAAVGGRRLVGAGTCAEYDWGQGRCVERVTPLAPREVYGVCKAATGELLQAFGKATSVSVAWGRMFHLFGPGDHPSRVVASVLGALRRGEPARCSRGEQARDFMFVVDAGEAFAALLDATAEGPINIGAGEAVRLAELLTRVAARAGRPDLLRLGALPDRPGDPPFLVADVTRLRDEVGYRPRHDLDAAVDATVRADPA